MQYAVASLSYACCLNHVCLLNPPAVHHGGGVEGVLVHVLPHEVAEVNQELSALRDAVIRPGREVEMAHRMSFCGLYLESGTYYHFH